MVESKNIRNNLEKVSNIFSDKSFRDFNGINQKLLDQITTNMKFSNATKIQYEAFKAIASSRDTFIRSETGSGKTLAYLVPLVNSLAKEFIKRDQGTKALILAPTRELCIQILSVLKKLVNSFPWIVPGTLMGGEKRKSEKARLRKGVTVLIATPGRCLDHFENTQSFNTKHLKWLIFDEADRLLDLGFEDKMRGILDKINQNVSEKLIPTRINILVSATLTEKVDLIANLALKSPIYVGIDKNITKTKNLIQNTKKSNKNTENLKNSNFEKENVFDIEDFVIPEKVSQAYLEVDCSKKLLFLVILLMIHMNEEKSKIIVFVLTCKQVKFLHTLFTELISFLSLNDKKLYFFQLHGEMSQKDRTSIYFKFCDSFNSVLFCTDIAARGLDLPGVSFIIQYDAPVNPKEYIHKIGRTARLNKEGKAVIMLTKPEMAYLDFLQTNKNKVLKIEKQVLLKEFSFLFNKSKKILKSQKNSKKFDFFEELILSNIYSITSDFDIKILAENAFDTYVKAYTTYPKELKHIFHQKFLNFNGLAKSFGIKARNPKKAKKRIETNFLKNNSKKVKQNLTENTKKKFDYAKISQNKFKKGISEFAA